MATEYQNAIESPVVLISGQYPPDVLLLLLCLHHWLLRRRCISSRSYPSPSSPPFLPCFFIFSVSFWIFGVTFIFCHSKKSIHTLDSFRYIALKHLKNQESDTFPVVNKPFYRLLRDALPFLPWMSPIYLILVNQAAHLFIPIIVVFHLPCTSALRTETKKIQAHQPFKNHS